MSNDPANGRFMRYSVTWEEELAPRYTGLTPCWNCISHRPNNNGYPYYGVGGRSFPVYRLIYEECFGFLTESLIVRHKCDNRMCINPEHLEPGTRRDNIADMVSRGRSTFGTKNPHAKLSEADVATIRSLAGTRTGASLARQFNVSEMCIYSIKYRLKWRHLK